MAEVVVPGTKATMTAIRAAMESAGIALPGDEELRIRSRPQRPVRLPRGIDAAHMAGQILRHFGRLDEDHQLVLSGILLIKETACSCGRPCCSGWSRIPRYTEVVSRTCAVLRLRAEIKIEEGDFLSGLGTAPAMRRDLVEEFFRGVGPSITDLAAFHGVTRVTVSKHRGLIHQWLGDTEREAWGEAMAILGQAEITGCWD